MSGKNFLITAGPTREAIDPVRYISNYSSGKMGYALAEAAITAGHKVTLITGPVSLTPPAGVTIVNIESTEQLLIATKRYFPDSDCLIMAAAPTDYQPKNKSEQKIKRAKAGLQIELEPTTDILIEISKIRTDSQFVVGFALETENGIANAKAKLERKGLDLIVLNQPSEDSGFDTDTNRVEVIHKNGNVDNWELDSKKNIAFRLLDLIDHLILSNK